MANYCNSTRKEVPVKRSGYFVGRHDERETLKTFLCESDIPLIQIYGLPHVGKTQLVKTSLQEISQEISPQLLHWDYFCINKDSEWSTIQESLDKFLSSLSNNSSPHIYVLDDFHKLRPSDWSSFQQFCDTVFIRFLSVRMVLVISGWKAFTIEGVAYEKFKVLPLSVADSESLFCRRSGLAISEETEACVNYLVESCNCLPGLLVRLADRLENLLQMMSLEYVCHCLNTSDNFYDCLTSSTPLNRNAHVFDRFEEYVANLPPDQQRVLSVLSCFDGHFGVDVATEITETERQSTFYNLVSLVEQNMLTSDVDFKKFRVQRIARDFADERLKHLRCNDVVKLKYNNIIGQALLKAEEIYQQGLMSEAIGIVNDNWENIESLMRNGIHLSSDQNAFPVYYQVAIQAEEILISCYPRTSKDFFRGCLENSYLFGNKEEQALMRSTYGRAITAYPGQMDKAESLLFESMESMSSSEHPTMSLMLNTMGVFFDRRGNQMEKALTWYMKSLSMRRKVATINREQVVISLCNVSKLLSRIKGKHVVALRLLMEANQIMEEFGWIHLNSALIQRYISDVYKRQGNIQGSILHSQNAVDIYTKINPNYFGLAKPIADLAHSYLLIRQPRSAIHYFQKIYDMREELIEHHPTALHLSGALEHIVRLSIDTLQIQKSSTKELITELRRLAKLPGIDHSSKVKYLLRVGTYSSALLLIEKKIGMTEERAGILWDTLPDTCYYCDEFMQYSKCTQQEYINLINGL